MAAVVPEASRTTVELALRGQRSDVKGRLFAGALLLTLLLSLLVLLMMLGSVVSDAWAVLSERGLGFLNDDLSRFESRAGVRQGLIGSLVLITFVAVIAVPLGIAAAVYLQEYARDTRGNRVLITNIRNLAGVPSIVYGIFGVVVFADTLRSVTGPESSGLSYITGGLTLTVLVMPFMIIITMEALRAVPRGSERRRTGWAPRAGRSCGVTSCRMRLPASSQVPSSRSRERSARRLPPARGSGHWLPESGGSGNAIETLQGRYTALPTIIFAWSREPGDGWAQLTAAAIVVLLVVILLVNLAAILLRNRYERKW